MNICDQTDNYDNILLAVIYFVSGVSLCGMNLTFISALPDCAGSVSTQYLTLLTTLLIASTSAILPSTFLVPSVIGIDNDIIPYGRTNAICGFVQRLSLLTTTLLYALTVVQRCVRIWSNHLTTTFQYRFVCKSVLPQWTICAILFGVLCFSLYDTILHMRSSSLIYFDASQLVWIKPESMLVKDRLMATVFLISILLVYTVIALQVAFEQRIGGALRKVNKDGAVSKLPGYLLLDVMFMVLTAFIYDNGDKCNTQGGVPSWKCALLGYLQSFGHTVCLAISAFCFCAPLREAIMMRLRMMSKGRFSKRDRSRARPMPKFSIKAGASPVFVLFVRSKPEINELLPTTANNTANNTFDSRRSVSFVEFGMSNKSITASQRSASVFSHYAPF